MKSAWFLSSKYQIKVIHYRCKHFFNSFLVNTKNILLMPNACCKNNRILSAIRRQSNTANHNYIHGTNGRRRWRIVINIQDRFHKQHNKFTFMAKIIFTLATSSRFQCSKRRDRQKHIPAQKHSNGATQTPHSPLATSSSNLK